MYEGEVRAASARFHFYSSDLNQRITRKIRARSGMRRALERHEFALHYQPKVDLRTGRA